MKGRNMRIVNFILATVIGSSAFAQDFLLEDGVYDTKNPSMCAHRVINNLPGNSIYLQGVSTARKECGDTNTTDEAVKGDSLDYILVNQRIVIDQKRINNCQKRSDNSLPCSPKELYDSTGNLIFKIDDILLGGVLIKPLNQKAFTFSPMVQIFRNNELIKKIEIDLDKIIYLKVSN